MTEIPEHFRKSAEAARERAANAGASADGEDVAASLGANANGLGADPFMPPAPRIAEDSGDSEDVSVTDGRPVRDGLDSDDSWTSSAHIEPPASDPAWWSASSPSAGPRRTWKDDLDDAGLIDPDTVGGVDPSSELVPPPVPPLPPAAPSVAPAEPDPPTAIWVSPTPAAPVASVPDPASAAPVSPVAPVTPVVAAPSSPPPASPPPPPPPVPWDILPGRFVPGNDRAARMANGAVAIEYVLERLEDPHGRYPGVELRKARIEKVTRRSKVATRLARTAKSLWNFGGFTGLATGSAFVGAMEYLGTDGTPGELKYSAATALFGAGYAAAGVIKPAVGAAVRDIYSDVHGAGRRRVRQERRDYERNRRGRSAEVRRQIAPLMAKREGQGISPEIIRSVGGNELMDLLSYTDTLTGQMAIDALVANQNNPNTPKYIRELDGLQKRFGIGKLKETAWDLGDELADEMRRIGLVTPSVYGRSISWAVWDLVKQSYLVKHPDESGDGYVLRDPLSSSPGIAEAARKVMVERQLGWEFDQLRGPTIGSGTKYRDFPRKPDGNLSSKDYARLGEMLRRGVLPPIVPG